MLRELLTDAKNLKDLWRKFSDWFFAAKWLQIEGGELRRRGSVLTLVIPQAATTPYSFQGSVSLNDSGDYVLTVAGGSVQSGPVSLSCAASSSVVSSKTIAYLALSYDSLTIDFASELIDPEKETMYLPAVTFDPAASKLTQHLRGDVIQLNFVCGFTPPEDGDV